MIFHLSARHARRLPDSVLPLRRTFIQLPKLGSILSLGNDSSHGSKGLTQEYHQQKILPYTRRQLYNIVSDVSSYPNFVPFCTNARILTTSPILQPMSSDRAQQLPAPSVMEAELTVGFMSLKESYVSRVTCVPHDSVRAEASSSTPLFKTLVTEWRFQPARFPSAGSISSAGGVSQRADEAFGGTSGTTRTPLDPDDDNGPTMVTLDLAYAFSNPLHAAISASFFGQVSALMVEAFEKRCNGIYGSRMS
ncbi:hypothetical protein PUNSTDRAFT_100548 [Punctularia strigosozonata HHB-11173 SS5]|uniref:uncharacterized protein n=1 Tax=Punctularia strigosozonata (strain HHB-11173) TaxID=741275 RepID=UPI0004418099|nr:uncharacterized protein PUNSTDRAFT_100548 [Punctularia strigosozonata HHB-11173 SS5]EIN10774.1 hypothetical protein PUNSTDRAFT_100548 [Punctularia strigosozonata HHB-11173 SS5]